MPLSRRTPHGSSFGLPPPPHPPRHMPMRQHRLASWTVPVPAVRRGLCIGKNDIASTLQQGTGSVPSTVGSGVMPPCDRAASTRPNGDAEGRETNTAEQKQVEGIFPQPLRVGSGTPSARTAPAPPARPRLDQHAH
eukprot:gene15372-biopygen3233